ncbi:MAG TPA: flagellar brake domain-containing protein, partial [Bacillales bacterium]
MKIGTTLYLDLEEDKYRSRLVEKREGYLFIDLPIDLKTNRTSLLREGTTLRVSFSAGENTLYAFESVIRGRKLGRIPMLVLDYPGEDKFIRLQRREFVRITDSIDIAVHPKEERFPAFTTTTLDLSGGGTAIHLPKNHGLKEEMEVRCWIVLPMRLG